MEDPGHWKPVLISPNGLRKPGERAHDRNLISAVGGILTHNLLIESPACYHWAITATWVSPISIRYTIAIFAQIIVEIIAWEISDFQWAILISLARTISQRILQRLCDLITNVTNRSSAHCLRDKSRALAMQCTRLYISARGRRVSLLATSDSLIFQRRALQQTR